MNVLFHVFNEDITTQKLYSKLGAPYAIQIYHGQYWGIFTNSFLHVDYIHLTINCVGLAIFGYFTENKLGMFPLLIMIALASISTSALQLTLTNDAGLGFDGINFFLFSLLFTMSLLRKEFTLPYKWTFLIGAICLLSFTFYINFWENQSYAIEAMFSGLLLGFVFGLVYKSKIISFLLFSILISSSFYSLFYAPWSAEWNYSKGYTYHEKYDFKTAKKFYRKAIDINPQHSVSKENLRIIKIEELSDAAHKSHINEDYLKARELYNKILIIDSKNAWAKENLNKLP